MIARCRIVWPGSPLLRISRYFGLSLTLVLKPENMHCTQTDRGAHTRQHRQKTAPPAPPKLLLSGQKTDTFPEQKREKQLRAAGGEREANVAQITAGLRHVAGAANQMVCFC